jgi:hypothetical protein
LTGLLIMFPPPPPPPSLQVPEAVARWLGCQPLQAEVEEALDPTAPMQEVEELGGVSLAQVRRQWAGWVGGGVPRWWGGAWDRCA